MRYIEALTEYSYRDRLVQSDHSDVLFLAGGITNCPDWQANVAERLAEVEELTILNPRRANFPIDDPSAAREQIEWEYRHLQVANIILFWFPAETLCPISLYELGTWTDKAPLLYVGTHPEYQRREDIVIQTRLRRSSDQIIYDDLDEMTEALRTLLTADFSLL